MKLIYTDNYELTRVQENAASAITDVLNIPLLSGEFFNVTASAGTDIIISHKLNRVPIGYLLVKSDISLNLYDSPSTNLRPRDQIILRASASGNIKVYVF